MTVVCLFVLGTAVEGSILARSRLGVLPRLLVPAPRFPNPRQSMDAPYMFSIEGVQTRASFLGHVSCRAGTVPKSLSDAQVSVPIGFC